MGPPAELLLRLLSLASGVALLWALTGCGGSSGALASAAVGSPAAPESGSGSGHAASGLHGRVQAGPQQITGAHIYLYAANHAGYGAASLWLLTPGAPGVATDDRGPYVTTDGSGSFDLTGRYGCIPGQLVYVLAQGGSPGGAGVAENSATAMMSVLGTCPAEGHFATDVFVNINQVSTVVTAYALAGWMADPGHLSGGSSDNAAAGMQNAFATAANLLDATSGSALGETPNAPGVPPQAEINTLANLLVPCTESASATACGSLFTLTPDAAGHQPTDTAVAMLNIAHNPGANVPALFQLAAGGPFAPALAQAPHDWTLAITYYAEHLAGPYMPAIDKAGNVWVPGYANNTLTEFSPTGELLSGDAGFSGGGLAQPFAVAIDSQGDAWVSNFGGANLSGAASGTASVSEFAANGSALTPSGYGCGASCSFLAIDGNSNVWVSGSPQVTTLKPTGTTVSAFNSNGFGAGLALDSQGRGWTVGSGRMLERLTLPGTVASFPESVTAASGHDLTALAIDGTDNVWVVSNANNALAKHSNDGTALSPAGGYTGGGLDAPAGVAIDGSGQVWIANRNGSSVSAFRQDGTAITDHGAYTADGVSNPRGIAVDASGNVWVTNFTGNSVTQFVGLATPTATPLAPGTHGQRP